MHFCVGFTMRIVTELVRETSIIDQESRDATALLWYLNTFDNPYLATLMFSSHHRCSNCFKNDRFRKHIYRCCKVFGILTTVKILIIQRKFFIPRSILNPTLRLSLNELNETDCKGYFRFGHSDIKTIITHLQLPEVIITPHHADRVLVVEALCLVLHRLSYPCCWFDLQNQFGRHVSAMSRIFYYFMHLLLEKVKRGLCFVFPSVRGFCLSK